MVRGLVGLILAFLFVPTALAQSPVQLNGAVKAAVTLDEATLKSLPEVTLTVSFETSSGTETGTYTGVLLWDVLAKAGFADEGKNPSIRHAVWVTAADGYTTLIAAAEADPKFGNKQVLIAFASADKPVDFAHLRVLVPGDVHGGRAVRDVTSIEIR